MKRWSLRIQITVAVGLIVTLACVALTLHSIYSANSVYGSYLTDAAPEHFSSYEENLAHMVEPDRVAALNLGFSIQGLCVMAMTIVAALAFTWWSTGRLLRPLEKFTESMKTIDEGHLSQPLPDSGGTAEVRQLAESFHAMLQRLDESFQVQRRFAADAAHELKTPLAAMKTSLQVLQMDEAPSTEEYQEFTQDMEGSLERLIRTVESLLALADAPKQQQNEHVALRALAGEVVKGLTAKAQAYSVSLSVSGEEISVPGCVTLFYRALYNVVDNAIKYNRPGGLVKVILNQEPQCASILISDTGIGIPVEHLDAIFDPFYRVDPSRSQQIEGSGLGLAIVRQIMQRYGGSVTAQSTPGTGTSVVLRFQLLPSTEA